ncbi:hypothetical protein [Neobacillus cucumis]|uniref:hypothetical protein n=1 Tax=Neobacillus cucumis TaxID=1740721 RepID=UPI001EF85F38|nr:hypothetical protein [Neobacillus cucumis]MBM7653833.1 hypothetical protein [Neobacillus cucumis]
MKNFEGDFCLEKDRFYAVKSGREYKNPITQLSKCASQFRQLLHDLKLYYPASASVILINPEFTLYNAQVDHPIILPNQVNRFLKSINSTSSKLNDGHKKLAKQLLSLHQAKNPYSQVPNYQYKQMKREMYCKFCSSFLVSLQNHIFVCGKSGGHETVEDAILRNVKEFQLLFPEQKITTYEWCNVDLSKRTFCRVLKITAVGKTSDSYYINFVLMEDWSLFGQSHTYLACPCRKFIRLRTPSHLFGIALSDVHSTSDTASSFWYCLVRTLLDFGHHLIFWVLPCPMFNRLRTPLHLFGIAVSDVYSTSDTTSSFWYRLVRCSSDFGHHLIFLVLPCPMFTRLRTPLHLFGLTLSDVHPTSDTTSSFWYRLVQCSFDFGHCFIILALPCPNFTRLRTPLHLFGIALSDVYSTSDTTSSF